METYNFLLLGIKDSPDRQFPPARYEVGDQFLVGVTVVSRGSSCALQQGKYTPRTWIDWQVIVATETGWDTSEGDSWSAWSPDDVTFWTKLPHKPSMLEVNEEISTENT